SRPPTTTTLIGPRVAQAPAAGADLRIEDPAAVAAWVQERLTAPPAGGDDWDLVLLDDCHEWERGWESGDARRTAVEQLAALVESARERRTAVVVATDADDARARQHVA